MPSSTPSWMKLPPKVLEVLQNLYLKLTVLPTSEIIWERILTDEERHKLGPDGWRYNFVPIWMKWHKMSQERAIIELARPLGLIPEYEYSWLLKAIGETPGPARKNDRSPRKPHWDRDLGQLRWGDTVIRHVRGHTVANRVVPVLDAFQHFGWRKRIPISDPTGIDGQQLRDAVKSLNVGLSTIRFRSDGTGKGVVWERV